MIPPSADMDFFNGTLRDGNAVAVYGCEQYGQSADPPKKHEND